MKNQTVTMKELPLSERPYELLEAKGEAALTDAQLLAILLRTGSAGEKALDLSLRILSSIPTKGQSPLVALLQQPLTSLRSFKGVGRVQAIQIRALAELVRRASHQQAVPRLTVDSPAAIVQLYMEEMRYLTREVIKIVYFNAKMQLLGDRNLTQGTMNQSLISPREVFQSVWEMGAYAFILIHNHPSGNPEPSLNDILLTDQLKRAAKLMDIPMLDHLVLGNGKYYSFKEHQKMQ